jgi:hypothetical protein
VFPYLVVLVTGDTVIRVYERGEGCDGGVVYLVEYFLCFLIPMVYLIYLVVFEWMTLLKMVKDFKLENVHWRFYLLNILSGFFSKFIIIA